MNEQVKLFANQALSDTTTGIPHREAFSEYVEKFATLASDAKVPYDTVEQDAEAIKQVFWEGK